MKMLKLIIVVTEIKNNGGNAIAVQSDITKPNEVTEMFNQIESELGNVNILINNAGIIKDSLLIRMFVFLVRISL